MKTCPSLLCVLATEKQIEGILHIDVALFHEKEQKS